MSDQSQLAVSENRPKASQQLAVFLGMDPQAMLNVIKAQCFRSDRPVTDEQVAAFVVVANEMKLNPLLPGFLYAYPTSSGGIVPMMGPDGVYKKLSDRKDVKHHEVTVYPEDVTLPPTHAVASIYLDGREKPLTYTAIFAEWRMEKNPVWSQKPRHMLSLRALKQCARQVIHGIPFDEDERKAMEEINVTPQAEGAAPEVQQQTRAEAPARKRKGANAVPEAGAPAQQPAIEAEVVDIKTGAAVTPQAQAETTRADTAPVASTAAPTTPAATTPAAPAAEPAKTEVITGPRAFLKDGEIVELHAVVDAVAGLNLTQGGVVTPSLSLKLKGDFNGTAYLMGAGVLTGKVDEKGNPYVTFPPEWQPGKGFMFKLRGKANPKKVVNVFVDGFTPDGGATAEEV